jgi:hypothetical protein
MNLKMNLTYLLLLIGMVIFSNQADYAQKGPASIFQADTTGNFLKGPSRDFNQGDLSSGLSVNQMSYRSRFETRDEESKFIVMNRKYYRKESEIIKASPVVLNSSFGYYTPPSDSRNHLKTKEFFLHRSKNQKTTAWILFGTGTAMIFIGYIGISMEALILHPPLPGGGEKDFTPYENMISIGTYADLISVPFFISAHHNKKKATYLSFGNQSIYSPLDKSYSQNLVPSLTLRIKL